MEQYVVTGMTCAACQAHVEKAVASVPGVRSVAVSLLTNSMAVEGDAGAGDVIKAVEAAGYGASVLGDRPADGAGSSRLAAQEDALKDRETPKLERRLALSLGFLVALMYITMGHNMLGWPLPAFLEHNHIGLAITQMLIAIAIMLINRAFFVSGFRSLAHRAPNMDTLVALGSSVSFGWSLYVLYRMTVMVTAGTPNMDLMELYHNELYFESAAMIPALITVGKTLESISRGRTTDALKHLMKMAPRTAFLEKDGTVTEVSIDQVRPGDVFVVKAGESVPADGVVLDGNAAIDESALTGESLPVDRQAGDQVRAATISRSGYIRVKALKVGEDTAFSEIIRMVSDAAATKAPIARIADRVSGVFVPAVIAISLVVLIGWLLAGQPMAYALERAISVLVISCPCALGLATPVAIMVGSGVGAKNGILFKTGEALETAGKVQIVALDKTGTITAGHPEVTDVIPAAGLRPEALLKDAYALEQRSEHPLAEAIMAYCRQQGIEEQAVADYTGRTGSGVQGRLGQAELLGGSGTFMAEQMEIPQDLQRKGNDLAEKGRTPLYFARDGKVTGIIAVADVIKEDSAAAIRELRAMGIEVVMLTGDNQRTADVIGAQAGVDRIIAGVLPDGKEAVIRDLQARGRTAMVGDGINDAPALARADVGIAIGAGTDVAIDSADVVLMKSRLTDVSAAVRLSRSTLRNIHENLFWAFAYNAILIPMAAGLYPGIRMNPMWGAAAMSISSFTVCMNALRLNLLQIHDTRHDRPLSRPALPATQALPERQMTILVNGMMCTNCEQHVQKALTSVAGITEARADFHTGRVKVTCTGEPDEAKIREAVRGADYEYVGIEKNGKEEQKTMEKTLKIEGMMCEHCEMHVKKALESVAGVAEATADHEKGTAVVRLSGKVDEEAMKKAVKDAGYEVKEIR